MNIEEIIAEAKALTKKREKFYRDRRYLKVVGFLCGKKLLQAESIKKTPNIKVSVKDAVWAANNVEPRILEVLPAAILHFPRSFVDLRHLPETLKEVLECLEQGRTGPAYNGIAFEQLLRWAQYTPSDRRIRPLDSKRVARSFRLTRPTANLLTTKAKAMGVSESSYLSELILK